MFSIPSLIRFLAEHLRSPCRELGTGLLWGRPWQAGSSPEPTGPARGKGTGVRRDLNPRGGAAEGGGRSWAGLPPHGTGRQSFTQDSPGGNDDAFFRKEDTVLGAANMR